MQRTKDTNLIHSFPHKLVSILWGRQIYWAGNVEIRHCQLEDSIFKSHKNHKYQSCLIVNQIMVEVWLQHLSTNPISFPEDGQKWSEYYIDKKSVVCCMWSQIQILPRNLSKTWVFHPESIDITYWSSPSLWIWAIGHQSLLRIENPKYPIQLIF